MIMTMFTFVNPERLCILLFGRSFVWIWCKYHKGCACVWYHYT